MADCTAIAAQLQASQKLTEELFDEYQDASPGPARSEAFARWRQSLAHTALLAQELHDCHNAPRLPDLVPVSVQIHANAVYTAFAAAVVITNQGDAQATGPFDVILGATYPDESYHEITLTVPANVVMLPGTSYTTSNIFTQIPIIEPRTYIFYVFVDPNNQVPESNDANNTQNFTVQLPPFLKSVPETTKELDRQKALAG